MTQQSWLPPESGQRPAPTPRKPVADLFEETFRLYRRAFVVLVAISAVVQVPLVLATVPMWSFQSRMFELTGDDPSAVAAQLEEVWSFMGLFIVLAVVGAILGTFGAAATVYVTARARAGERPTFGDVLSALGRLAGRLLGYLGVWLGGGFLVAIGVAVVLFGVAAAATILAPRSDLDVLWTVLALLVLFVVGIAVIIRLALALPVLVLEDMGPVAALVRSWNLVRGSVLRTLGIFLVAWIAISVLTSIASPLYLPGMMEGLVTGSTTTYLVLGLVSAAVNTLVTPILPILLTLLYFDYAARQPASA